MGGVFTNYFSPVPFWRETKNSYQIDLEGKQEGAENRGIALEEEGGSCVLWEGPTCPRK